MTKNDCIIEEIVDGTSTYFLYQLRRGDCDFYISDMISKPKGLKSKYIKFNYLPTNSNVVRRNDVNLYIRKEVFYDDNIIDLEPIVVQYKDLTLRTAVPRDTDFVREVHLRIKSLELLEGIRPNIIVLDLHNLEVLKKILSDERYSQLALEVELQGGINL